MTEHAPIDPPIDPNAGAYHYGVMARAIEAIDAAGGAPLPLEDLARRMSMSPAHFQRVFTRWAGVSPKRLQQYLTLGHAKALLAERFTTFDAAHAAGLSGGGRLHDLFVTWEAMTPGEWAAGNRALRWAWVDSPFGHALVFATERGIAAIGFEDGLKTGATGREAAFENLARRFPRAELRRDPASVAPLADAAFAPGPNGGARLAPIGAPFQIKVWEALMRVPSGHVTTYGEIAGAIGNPRAVRAVGTAVGRNPVSWLIPCHRAIRATGGLGGYHWGLPRKRAMLALEAAGLAPDSAAP
ncbi:AraC family transcriptional regulator of adaptative response/methylated-DNA-[protein]-cysteine methyltransferase [Hasllibacter halocynthiae]|uniref:methylated-DNA--[protein]-cysteine S-methyltransferase n=1 Tax=Hasllibacter halocynthiae TaxID=595589 RepID=A0A2T0X3W4_9RHOB|nr:bifunctional helix-turn-helix domain-containing protein/methylated-DNA--[protein]-cysteine S-methyltransferase [Hasllibacter halocynthiae]PRY93554.1 AraC family transcriptional regulator of adaptative response/methylated-DNA-[protein]-cysteine methyltransferase [Hasllibacter halocynthiae]